MFVSANCFFIVSFICRDMRFSICSSGMFFLSIMRLIRMDFEADINNIIGIGKIAIAPSKGDT